MITAGPAHASLLATLHAAAFPPGEQWAAASITEVLAMPGAFGFLDEQGGFVLARSAGGEAEILTLAVHPDVRRAGVARRLVTQVLAAARDMPVFLEVAADNEAARALYAGAGFAECGRRRAYYGAGRDAIVLRR